MNTNQTEQITENIISKETKKANTPTYIEGVCLNQSPLTFAKVLKWSNSKKPVLTITRQKIDLNGKVTGEYEKFTLTANEYNVLVTNRNSIQNALVI